MKKGFRGTGTVERVDFPNKGIAVTDDGDRVIVKNTIPGQKVEFVVNKVKHQRAEGRLMEVIEKSPLETEEPCPHFGMCGGCSSKSFFHVILISLYTLLFLCMPDCKCHASHIKKNEDYICSPHYLKTIISLL